MSDQRASVRVSLADTNMNNASLVALLLAMYSPWVPAEVDVPPVLEPWQEWVLHGDDTRRCPPRVGVPLDRSDARICAWPGALTLEVAASGAVFAQRWTVYAEEWVPLPGGTDHWPVAVRVDGRPAAVLDRDGRPVVRLEPGEHAMTGRVVWQERPATLSVPAASVLFDLKVDGRRIEAPERSLSNGVASLWLGERVRPAEKARLDLRVHRRLEDAIPGRLETRLLLAVAGSPREVTLGPVLPSDYRAISVTSDLPARLDEQQRLRVQLQRGNWPITILARAPGIVDTIEMPAAAAPWPARETLSFAPEDILRIVTVDGATAVDPAQAGVPAEWHGLPAYVLERGDRLTLLERSRGLAGDAGTRLELERDLWLDFDHSGWLARDRLHGELSGRWRLAMAQPWKLLSASSHGMHLPVTRLAGDDAGVELRSGRVELDALAALPAAVTTLPATGWQHDLAAATTRLHLPPGHRLIAAPGVAESVGDWLGQWDLLDIFVALLVTVAAYRLLGATAAMVALPALALTYHEPLAPTWLWVNLVLAVALVRALPQGRLRRWAGYWRSLGFVLMLIALLPFAFMQLRLALFPQLSAPGFGPWELPARHAPVPGAPPIAEDAALESVAVTSQAVRSPAAKVVDEARDPRAELTYPPGTVAQTGPARPAWQYQDYLLRFAAPVTPEQSVRLVIAPPWAMSSLRVLAVALSVLLLLLLAGGATLPRARPDASARVRATVSMLMLLAAAVPWSSRVLAQAQIPPPELLRELEQRLLEPPTCAPECADLALAAIAFGERSLLVSLEVHAAAPTAFPLPRITGAEVTSVVADGGRDTAVVADPQGQPWALVVPGVQTLVLEAALARGAELQVRFPRVPKRVAVHATGWNVAGITEGRLVGDSITLQREAPEATDRGSAGAEVSIQPFVRLIRDVSIDIDWKISTRVVRLAPQEGGLTVTVPLLPGEAVTETGPGVAVDAGTARVSLQSGQGSSGWRSTLQRESVIELDTPADANWTEVWNISAAPSWHLEFAGTPEIAGSPGGERRFLPRPGENLSITVTRPEVVAGELLVLDAVTAQYQVGPRATAMQIDYRYRSTQGGRQLVRLPAGSTLEDISVDGRSIALRLEDDVLALPIEPGEHAVLLRAQAALPVAWRVTTPSIDLGAPAGNVSTRLELPANRWILWAQGTGVGPAILYWSELVAFLVLAVLVGRHRQSPLRTHEWLLLGLGLSTFSWWVLLIFAGWLFTMRWRERTQLSDPVAFNVVQIVLAVLAVIALLALVSAIPNGLLGAPDMRIAGPGSYGSTLSWFDDRVTGELPGKTAINVSLWWYKAAMLGWALWLSFALVRWVPWAWRAYSSGDYWRRRPRKLA